MTAGSDRPRASTAEAHFLFNGYATDGDTPEVSRVASTVAFVREGDVRVIIDPGMIPYPGAILEPLAALGESPETITDVIFSHHHPDHTLNAALFPNARFHDNWAIYQGDRWESREAEGYEPLLTCSHTRSTLSLLCEQRNPVCCVQEKSPSVWARIRSRFDGG
jgi:glyoxylase-like metal-dependent hydrolase (beta-lactamase superfamily II)